MATLNINGQKVKVGDDFLKLTPEQQNATVDEIAAKLGAGSQQAQTPGPLSAGTAPASTAAPPVGPVDYLSQGLSGINEGIGNILGFPVDMTTLGINAATMGVNKLTGTQIPQITNPVGGSDSIHKLMSPTIGAESSNPGLQMTRRVGQEVGAMMIPGAGPIVRSARPAVTLGRELLAATGSGLGGAIAQQAAPGNALVEFAGQTVGSLTPGGIARAARRPGAPPTIDALRAEKNAAYQTTQNMGVAYSPNSYDGLLANIATAARADRISPERHAAAYSFIRDMVAHRGQPVSLTELDQIRQMVRRDLITPSYGNQAHAADAHFGHIILDEIDDFIHNARTTDLVSGNARDAANAIITARSANTRYRKAEMIEEALTKAARRTESTGSGGNINNAIRQNIRSILDSPKKRAAFTRDEIHTMEQLVRQGRMENFLRLVGKLSPSGNGLMAALGIGGTMINPTIGLASLAGAGAKAMADRGTINRAIDLQNQVARGAPRPPQMISQDALDRQRALLLAQGANQKKPIEIVISGGAH